MLANVDSTLDIIFPTIHALISSLPRTVWNGSSELITPCPPVMVICQFLFSEIPLKQMDREELGHLASKLCYVGRLVLCGNTLSTASVVRYLTDCPWQQTAIRCQFDELPCISVLSSRFFSVRAQLCSGTVALRTDTHAYLCL